MRELTQPVMQNQWKAIGVEAPSTTCRRATFFGETLKKRHTPALAEFASTLEPTLVPWSRLSSQWIPSDSNNWAGQNYSGINDKRLDALIEAAQDQLDPAKQQAMWTEIQTIYATQLYGLPLYFRADPDIVPKWLTGYETTGKEPYVSYFAASWGHP